MSDLSATLERVRKLLLDHPPESLLKEHNGVPVMRVSELFALLAALARLQEERDRILEREARLNETRNWWVAEYDKLAAELKHERQVSTDAELRATRAVAEQSRLSLALQQAGKEMVPCGRCGKCSGCQTGYEVPENVRCPKCGYVTADPFNCVSCRATRDGGTA